MIFVSLCNIQQGPAQDGDSFFSKKKKKKKKEKKIRQFNFWSLVISAKMCVILGFYYYHPT